MQQSVLVTKVHPLQVATTIVVVVIAAKAWGSSMIGHPLHDLKLPSLANYSKTSL